MSTPRIHHGADVSTRLSELGLTFDIIENAITYGVQQAALCTEFDSPSFAGTTRYSRIGRRLRELLCPIGWTAGSELQMRVTNPHNGITVIHALGDENTGDPSPGVVPSQRHEKGITTINAVRKNTEATLFNDLPVAYRARYRHLHWMLLYRVEEEYVRSELSLPSATEAKGFVSEWAERIILPRVDCSPAVHFGIDSEPIDVPVQRRA